MYIPLMGGMSAWSNNLELPSWSRIDRFSLTLDWELHYLDAIQKEDYLGCVLIICPLS